MIEIERKFRLTSEKRAAILKEFKDKHGALRVIHQIDQVFLRGIESFKEFKRGMPVIRLRSSDSNSQLTFKRVVNDAGDALELEVDVSSTKVMQKILEQMDYRQATLVIKDRIEIKEDNMTLALDKVLNLGNFLEIEILSAEDDSGAIEKAILRKAKEFGLGIADIERKKYDELLSILSHDT